MSKKYTVWKEKEPFTIVNNGIFRYKINGKKLKPETIGMYVFLRHLPKDWQHSISGYTKVLNAGKGKIMRMLNELEEVGLIKRKLVKRDNGTFSHTHMDIFNKPKAPYPEKPHTDNRDTDNQPQQSTKELSTNELNKKQTKKKGLCLELFNKFWKVYPKKRGKGNALKWFKKHKPDEELVNQMIETVNKFKKSKGWLKENGQYIPYPTTWLNGEQWLDELDESEISNVVEQQFNDLSI